MKQRGIILIVVTLCFSLYFSSSFVFAFFFCPPEFPVNCGDEWCCTEARRCPEPYRAFHREECTPKELCPSTTIFAEDSEEVALLRYFRDNILTQTPEGREIINLYYQLSPIVVEVMKRDEEFKNDVKEMLDQILQMIIGNME